MTGVYKDVPSSFGGGSALREPFESSDDLLRALLEIANSIRMKQTDVTVNIPEQTMPIPMVRVEAPQVTVKPEIKVTPLEPIIVIKANYRGLYFSAAFIGLAIICDTVAHILLAKGF